MKRTAKTVIGMLALAAMAASDLEGQVGMGGVRISQISGTIPGTLHPGTYWYIPL